MSEQSWFLFATAGAIIGAVVQIIDMYLREDGIFSHPLEPTIVSGVMQAMLWVSIPFVGFEYPESGLIAGLAVLGGLFHIASLFFYFKGVFSFGDMSVISMLWNLLVAMVPILAFVLLGERLSALEYFGILLLFVGALTLSFSEGVDTGLLPSVSKQMLIAVFLMGLSMVCLKGVYEHTTYWGGYLFYNFGIVGGGVLGYIFFLPRRTRRQLHHTFRSFFFFFLGIEFLQLSGEFFSNLATSLGPVSLVSAAESLQPLFIVIIALGIFLAGKALPWNQLKLLRPMCLAQFQGLRVKVVAMVIMIFGVYLIQYI
ncbi:MAG: hypothetical protein WBC29_00510 [Candidatus Moraniibacteriota bacterium]